MKIINATIAHKSIKGVFPYEFTYEDGSKGIYLPDNMVDVGEYATVAAKKGKYDPKNVTTGPQFKTAQEVYEKVNKIVATTPISG